jgi:uncharacterized metal-binding protein YceD (DUF177 family)
MVAGQPEFSRSVEVAALAAGPVRERIEATEAERAALARRFGLVALSELRALVTLTPTVAGQARLDARLEARVVQACVVTLEPVEAAIAESFTVYYADAAPQPSASVDLPVDDEAWPEPIVDGRIDIGEAVAQQLALSLDPYPRAPGARLDADYGAGADAAEARPNPFAALAAGRGPRRSR